MRLIDADDFRSWLLKQKRLSKGYTLMMLDEAPTIDLVKPAQQEGEKSKPQYAERVKLYDDIWCDRLMTTCSWCYGRVGPHDKFCKHCGREFRDNSTGSKEALNT